MVRRGRVTWYQKSEVVARRLTVDAASSIPKPTPVPVPAVPAPPKSTTPDSDMAALLKRLQDLNALHNK
jgi:hypothetical protein